MQKCVSLCTERKKSLKIALPDMKLRLLLLFIAPTSLFAQDLSEGYFQYTIDVIAIDTSMETRRNVGMLYDSRMELYFAPKLTRADFKMGRMYSSSVIINQEKDSALVLTRSTMGNFAKYQRPDALEQQQMEKDPNAVVEIKDEFKTILGYECQKAIYTSNGQKMTYWITDSIRIKGDFSQSVINTDLPGFPMEFSANDGKILYTYTVSNLRLSIPDKAASFSLQVPEDCMLMP